jgi:hypothetical protein
VFIPAPSLSTEGGRHHHLDLLPAACGSSRKAVVDLPFFSAESLLCD